MILLGYVLYGIAAEKANVKHMFIPHNSGGMWDSTCMKRMLGKLISKPTGDGKCLVSR